MARDEPGTVGDSPAKITQRGDRIEALYNFGPGGTHDHIVSNDGLNAAYLREGGKVIVDDRLPDPYPQG